MTKTYKLACHDCRVSLWVGQGANGKPFAEDGYIYAAKDSILALKLFLGGHTGHRLEFNADEIGEEMDDYQEMVLAGEELVPDPE